MDEWSVGINRNREALMNTFKNNRQQMNTAAGVGSSLGYRSVLDFFVPFCIKTKGRCPPGIEGKSNDCLSAHWPRGLVLFLDKKDQKSSAFRRCLGAQASYTLSHQRSGCVCFSRVHWLGLQKTSQCPFSALAC
jgi:hypothetical protein